MVEQIQKSNRGFLLWESYGQKDQSLFFGRDQEVKLLYDKTFASNLVLLYGASGAGKTSLIRCGLGNTFEESDWFPIMIRKGDNINKSLSIALRRASEESEKLRNSSIREKVHHLFLEKFRPIYLIFDQFEELFILGDREEQGQFFSVLLGLLNANFQCKIILSINENYLAELDRYEEAIPMLFYNRMRVERMRHEQLEEVVRGMTQQLGIQLGGPDDEYEDQDKLIAAILAKVRNDVNRVDLGKLQIFMDELYAKDEVRRLREGNPTRAIYYDQALVAQIKYVDTVITRRLQKELEDENYRFKQRAGIDRLPQLLLRDLITEMETKRSREVEEVVQHLLTKHEVPPEYTEQCIRDLLKFKILRNLSDPDGQETTAVVSKRTRIEIIHDNLAKALYPLLFSDEQNIIRVKNIISIQYETYQEAGVLLSKGDLEYIQPYFGRVREELSREHSRFYELSEREVRKRELRLGILLASISLFLLLSLVVSTLFWTRSSRLLQANNIGSQALNALTYDRTRALRLAELAIDKDPNNTLANNVITDVLINSARFPFYQDEFEIVDQDIDRISDLDVSDNAKYLLAGSLDGGVYLLNLYTSDSLKELKVEEGLRHQQEITDLDWIGAYDEKTDKTFMTCSRDGTAKIWQIDQADRTVDTIKVFAHATPLFGVFFDRVEDSSFVYAAGEEAVYRWRKLTVAREWAVDTFDLPQTTAFEVVDFGKRRYIVAASRDTSLRVTPLDRFERPDSIRIPGESVVVSMEFDRRATEGRFVAGLADGRLITWPLSKDLLQGTSLKGIFSREAHQQAIRDVVFIKDGTQILTSSDDKTAKLWSADLTLQKTLLGHNDGVQTITSSEEGEIFTGGEDKTIKKWTLERIRTDSIRQGPRLISLLTYNQAVHKPRRLLFKSKRNNTNELVLYSGDDFEEEKSMNPKIPIHRISSITFLPSNRDQALITLADSARVYLLSPEGEVSALLEDTTVTAISGTVVSDDGLFLLTKGRDSAGIWKKNGPGSNNYVKYGKLPPKLRAAALCNQAGNLRILTVAEGHNKAFLWELDKSNRQLSVIDSVVHTDAILSVALSPDGRYLLTGSKDNSFVFRLVNTSSEPRQRHTADINYVAFSPNEKQRRFLTASQDGTVRLWNAEGREEMSLIDHGAPIVQAFFLSNAEVLTLGTDGLVKWWHLEDIDEFIQPEEGKVYSFEEGQQDGLINNR